jgi:hypothetical protein
MNTSPLSSIPTFGSPVLEGEFDMNSFEPGKPLRGSSKRQFVKFYNYTFTEVYTTKAKINEKTGNSVPVETDVRTVTKEMIEVVTPGDPNVINEFATDWHRRFFFKQYRAFREGKTAPIGLPIEEAQFISTHIATELKYLGCHTVEQLADASDLLCGNLPSGYELREYARSYCKAQIQNKSSPQVITLSNELDKLRAEIAQMKAQQAEALLVSPIGEPVSAAPKRGRKPKIELDITAKTE